MKIKPTYRADIDGLRALAILPVILFHANLGCPGGFVGVDIFFVISGFLITSLILKEIREDAFSLVMFWERRIRRILPPLVVVVLATLVAGWFLYLPEDFNRLGKSVVAQSLLMSNVFFWRQMGYFAPGVDTMPLLHTWSLAVEEQFYVLFPLFLIWLARHKTFSMARAILWLGVGSFALSVVGSYSSPDATFYLLPPRAWELMMGAFLAAIPERRLSNAWWNETAALSGLGLILYSIFYYTSETRFPGLAAIPPCLGAALIIFSGGAKPALVNRALALKPFVFIGLISYPLYLWHWPLLVFSKYIVIETQSWELRVALLLAGGALATASWKWIETPFRKRWLCPRRPQIFAFAGGSLLTLLMLGGIVYWQGGMPSRLPARAFIFSSKNYGKMFFNRVSPQEAAAGRFFELGGQSADQPIQVLLWGDSHAMAAAPALDELCRQFSVRGVEATFSATAPMLKYVFPAKAGLSEQGPAWAQSIVDFIARKHIKIVIIAAIWRSYGPPAVVEARLTETVQTIMASGASVYVVKDVPIPDFDVPRHATLTVLAHGDLARLNISPDKYVADNRAYEAIFNHLSKMGVTILDTPKYFLNANGSYDVIRNDKLLYIDDHHLSPDGAKLLIPMFEPLFRQL